LRSRGPLKDLKDSELWLNESKLFQWSSRISFGTIQNLQKALISQTSNWSGIFLAVSHSKSALVQSKNPHYVELIQHPRPAFLLSTDLEKKRSLKMCTGSGSDTCCCCISLRTGVRLICMILIALQLGLFLHNAILVDSNNGHFLALTGKLVWQLFVTIMTWVWVWLDCLQIYSVF
jgi:hypothetical protein